MGLMKKNVFAVFATLAVAISFTACGGGSSGGGTTVANVPANQCIQPGVIANVPGAYGQPGFQPGFQPGIQAQGQYGLGNPAPFRPYSYNGQGCGGSGVPTCYPNGGGLQCVPVTAYQNIATQGFNPMFYGYNQGGNSYGFQGYRPYGGAYFQFSFGFGSGGYSPNRYVQGCNLNSFGNSCGFQGRCRPLGYGNGLGICVQ